MAKYFFIFFSACLIVGFFSPWLNFEFNGVIINGYRIGASEGELSFLSDIIQMKSLGFVKVAYLLYVIPLLAVLHILSFIFKLKSYLLHFDYAVSAISVLIFYAVIYSINTYGPDYLDWGYKLVASGAIAGLLFQLFYFLWNVIKKGIKI